MSASARPGLNGRAAPTKPSSRSAARVRPRSRANSPSTSDSSEPERLAQTHRRLRRLRDEALVADHRALADGDEELVARRIFPAIARREAEILADVVVLQLQRELHI